jgi:hypothetical protein
MEKPPQLAFVEFAPGVLVVEEKYWKFCWCLAKMILIACGEVGFD